MSIYIQREAGKTWSDYIQSDGSELDRLALQILNLYGGNHLNCVAVYKFPDDQRWLVATNGLSLDVDLLKEELQLDFEFRTQGHLSSMHAEMKLLSVLMNDYGYASFADIEMGVSKPCCILCATVLDHYNVKYSMFHREETYWLSPFAAENVGCKRCERDDSGNPHVWLDYPSDFSQGVTIDEIMRF